MIIQRNKTEQELVSKELEETQIQKLEKMNQTNPTILAEPMKQSAERKLTNDLLAIKDQLQDYVDKDLIEKEMSILDFVKLYLKLFNMSQRELSAAFEMKEPNLYKYLKGERKLNTDLVLKLSSFTHTPPELWFAIQTKNELHELRKDKDKLKAYEKYDYKNFISLPSAK